MIAGLKFISGFLAFVIGGFLLIFGFLTLTAPRYSFPEPRPFSGNLLYNPYQDMDSTRWLKANFQVQSRVWGGLTNGRKNRSKDVVKLYRQLGYDFICFSDYQFINRYNENSPLYIPTYEHGFGIRKWHQVCIGAHERTWLDYPLWQTLSQKQSVIDHLNRENDIVAIAHPRLSDGYTTNDFKYLSGYQLIEVFNQIRCSEAIWDSALSAGHPAFILSDDDAHDISNPHLVGRYCTYINAQKKNGKVVVAALKSGKAYGAEIYMAEEDGYPEKIAYSKHMPFLKSAQLAGDTLKVEVSQVPLFIRFIGQHGLIRSTVPLSGKASCIIRKEDTYIRTEIVFPNKWGGNGTRLLLNPVFRYSGENPLVTQAATIDYMVTVINRVFAVTALLFAVLIAWFLRKKIYSRIKPGKVVNEQYG